MFFLTDVQNEIQFEEVDNITGEESVVCRDPFSLSWQRLSLKKKQKPNVRSYDIRKNLTVIKGYQSNKVCVNSHVASRTSDPRRIPTDMLNSIFCTRIIPLPCEAPSIECKNCQYQYRDTEGNELERSKQIDIKSLNLA